MSESHITGMGIIVILGEDHTVARAFYFASIISLLKKGRSSLLVFEQRFRQAYLLKSDKF